MGAAFLHYEVLGPRAGLDAWLGALQDAGVCHLADALRDLEAEPLLGRPALLPEEIHADLIRSEAARALRGVERVLPPTPRGGAPERRPTWRIALGRVGEDAVLALKDEARGLATAIRAALERVRLAEAEVARDDALCAALGEPAGRVPVVVLLPAEERAIRRLVRRLRRLGLAPRRVRGAHGACLLVDEPAGEAGSLDAELAAVGARRAALPEGWHDEPRDGARESAARALARAEGEASDARAALSALVRETGPRGRLLLDSLEDAERRTGARRLLASSEHVAAARIYVRREDDARLREHLASTAGDGVVLRPLAEAEDEPSLPRRIAAAPLAAAGGLAPSGYADASAASVLALLTPLAVGLAWADVAGGLLLLLAGGLLGRGAAAGSPRRDTALMAQVGGLVALLLGVLSGHAFGAAGEAFFGQGWGLLPGLGRLAGEQATWLQPFVAVLAVLGAFAALAGLWGLLLALRARARGRAAQARAVLLAVLDYAAVAGLAAAALGAAHPLHAAWPLAPAVALLALLVGGPRRFLTRLCLDLVGVLRLVAVAGGALLVFQRVLAGWVEPGLLDLLLGPFALLVAALAVVADPAHLAMGVPYDLSVGGRRLGRPFEPLRRRGLRAGEV